MTQKQKTPPAGCHGGASKAYYSNIISIFSSRQDQCSFTHIHTLSEQIIKRLYQDIFICEGTT